MKIKIFERCQPFSHSPGVRSLLPGTKEVIQAYPAKINDELLDVRGPLKEWTLTQNLEQGKIQIRGISQNELFMREIAGKQRYTKTKLTFGVHKAQQMDRIQERAAPEEFLPFWFALGQYYPYEKQDSYGDTLLNDLLHIDKLNLYQAWKNLFRAGFDGWMIPRAKDEGHHGFGKDPVAGIDPMVLLPAGAQILQEMLVGCPSGDILKVLPRLPPELHCGRLLELEIPHLGILSIEWSKKEIKKMILQSNCTREIVIEHPTRIQSFRVSTKAGAFRQTSETAVKLGEGEVLFFDQFQH